ncbi:ADP-ribose pyrophosphatase [Caenispirillum salinarum AK4]|uniref:ADP-ribose pyrophosphatase n=1 Tax=Caenispirillum salinarum AK4 TaxID=1238182 RepID=K9GUK4_9PROT|nr:NUDIX domain-containing protein [Caenispirillum salinarum]EKV28439.1 ADP-ribose pyrophosphatase [Caenispirillum salinarum AK4]
MSGRRVEIHDHEIAYDGYFRIERYTVSHSLHDGGMSKPLVRELFERGHASAVLPYDPERDEVVLVEQFRIGAHAAGLPAWELETVAGIIEAGETAEDVARRETQEEAALTVTDMIPIADYLSSPGGSSETVSLFCGRVDTTDAGGTVQGLVHEGEDILVSVLPYSELEAMVKRMEIHNAMTLIAAQWLVMNRDEVRRRWSA